MVAARMDEDLTRLIRFSERTQAPPPTARRGRAW